MLIIFDIDDTLVDTTRLITRPLWKKALQAMEGKGLKLEDPARALFHLWALDQNTQSASETLRLFLAFYKKDFSFHKIGLETFSGISSGDLHVKAIPFVLEGLKKLCKRHTLAIVSRGDSQFQKKKLLEAKIPLSSFHKIFISPKTDKKELYQKALEELQIPPQESCVVGDRVMVDLKPAKELGIFTIQMKWGRGRVYSPWSEYVDKEVHSFKEAVAYLQKKESMAVEHGG